MAKPRRRWRIWLYRLVVLGVSTLLTLVLIEGVLRLTRDANRFYPFHRNIVKVFKPPGAIKGVSGAAYFSTNRLGCRGREANHERHRLLVIGGSTTACTALDDNEAWPHLIMQRVNEHFNDDQFLWVTNSGISGRNSRHHVMHARYLVPQIPDLDHVLVYCGLNDVGLWLYKKTFDPDFLDEQTNWDQTIARSFRVCNYTPADYPWHKQLELWKRASIARARFNTWRLRRQPGREGIVMDQNMEWIERWRQRRRERAKKLVPKAKMQTFDTAMESYAENLRLIIKYVRAEGAEPILMAQAIRWRDLDEQEKQSLWMGAMDGGRAYVPEEQMQSFVDAYNKRMGRVAAAAGALFIDLPVLLEGKTDLFYDGCHFNEKGARETARVVAEAMIKHVYTKAAATSK